MGIGGLLGPDALLRQAFRRVVLLNGAGSGHRAEPLGRLPNKRRAATRASATDNTHMRGRLLGLANLASHGLPGLGGDVSNSLGEAWAPAAEAL